MKKIVIKVPPTRIVKFVDGFGKRRIFIRGVGSFLEDEVKIENEFQKKISEFANKYYNKVGW